MKTIFKLAISIIGIGCLSACQFNNSKNYKQNTENRPLIRVIEKKQLNIIGHWLNQGTREKLLRDAVRTFEFHNQEIALNLSFPEDIYMDQINSSAEEDFIANVLISSKPDWDIIRLNGNYKRISELTNDTLWAKNSLVDFSQIPEFRNTANPEILTDEFKESWGGILPGPALEGQYWCLYYNKKLADKIGISIKDENITFEDFKSYLAAVEQYNIRNSNDYIIPISEAKDWGTSNMIGLQLYASLFDDKKSFVSTEYNQSKVDNWFKVLESLEELNKMNPFDKNQTNIAWNSMSEEMLNDKYLFFINGSWMYNIWMQADPEKAYNCHPVQLPGLKQTNLYPMGYNVTWGVPKNSPNKQEAIDFLLYLNSSDIADQWVKATKSTTGIQGRMTDVNFGADQYEKFSRYINSTFENGGYNTRPNNSYLYGNNLSGLPDFGTEVLSGKMSADEAIQKIKELLNQASS